MVPGSTVTVHVMLRNTGDITWSESTNHRIGPQTGNQFMWSGFVPSGWANTLLDQRIRFSINVAPGSVYVSTFNIIAPVTPGVYTLQLQPVQDGVQWFGTLISKSITIGNNITVDPVYVWNTGTDVTYRNEKYDETVFVVALQGLVNRQGPRLYM
jgi:PBP1b-binding outer membrane lipoprotein LpoB